MNYGDWCKALTNLMYCKGGSMISNPILSVTFSGGILEYAHCVLQWRLIVSPVGSLNFNSSSVPDLYFL